MPENEEELPSEKSKIEIGYEPAAFILWSDISGLISLFHACFEQIEAAHRKKQIEKILHSESWFEHYRHKGNSRRVLSESEFIEHKHEIITAILLTQVGYDVVFAPKAMFGREAKKFDVFLMRDAIILKADLKSITSKNPDTIANRIKSGSDQASRVVIHINSDIGKKELIDGLRSGVERNSLIKEVLLFYKQRFYRLPKDLILSNRIFDIL